MKKFKKLYESLNTIKKVVIMRYPKQIALSEDFKKALASEIARFNTLQESKQPIINVAEKFLKALRFHVLELMEKKIKGDKKSLSQRDFLNSVRKPGIPAEKIIEPKKGKAYDRRKEKREWKKEIE